MSQRGDRREDQPLSDLQRDKFEDMLRKLSAEREDICAAMAFAMDNAESGVGGGSGGELDPLLGPMGEVVVGRGAML